MPFVSEAQREWMHIHHPEMAEEWESKTPKGKKLPEHKKAAASEQMTPSQAIRPTDIVDTPTTDSSRDSERKFSRPKDPFYERYPQDEPYFNVAATDPMRLKMRQEVMKDMGIDHDLRKPAAGSVRLVFDPTQREKFAVKVDAAYTDALDGTAEDGSGMRAIWSPSQNTWIKDSDHGEKREGLGSHSYTQLDLEPIFKDGAPARGCPTGVLNEKGELIKRNPGAIMGRGFFEADLVAMGIPKRDLRKLVEERMLEKVTVRHNGGWRNTYVLKMEVQLDA